MKYCCVLVLLFFVYSCKKEEARTIDLDIFNEYLIDSTIKTAIEKEYSYLEEKKEDDSKIGLIFNDCNEDVESKYSISLIVAEKGTHDFDMFCSTNRYVLIFNKINPLGEIN